MTVSPKLGVVIVTYNASEVIRPCLESLLTAPGAGGLAIVVVDNASPDGTADLIERWARGEAEQAPDPASRCRCVRHRNRSPLPSVLQAKSRDR